MAAQVIPYAANKMLRSLHRSDHPEPTIPTALICDNSLLRSELQRVLSGSPFVIAEAVSVAGPGRFQRLVPEATLVLIEASQNTGRALEIVRQVRDQAPEARIVVLADEYDLDFLRLGHEAGVSGFCLAASAREVLIKSLELVMLGESVVPSVILRSIVDGAPQNRDQPPPDTIMAEPKLPDLKACKLSAREMEILGCLTKGEPNKVIARKLEITEATIKVHVKAILRKIGATNRTQAAMWASHCLPRRGGASLSV